MDTSELIQSFSKRIGIELDADGVCAFEADGLAVTVHELRELEAVALIGDLGEPPPERLEGLYQVMLEANHLFGGTGGATLSRDPATGRFALCRTLAGASLTSDGLYAEVERFVSTMEVWARNIADFRRAPSSDNEVEAMRPGALRV